MFVFFCKNRNENKKEKINVFCFMKKFFLFFVFEEVLFVILYLELLIEV